MNLEIAGILAQDGIANGAIYVLMAIGMVMIFAVTRVLFVPFGDLSAFAALTLASFQLGRMPATVWLVVLLSALATAAELLRIARKREWHAAHKSLALYLVAPNAPVLLTLLLAGESMHAAAEVVLSIALVVPIGPLLYRIAFRPLADAPILVLLIVAVALHFAVSGVALLFFGPEGFRTRPFVSGEIAIGEVVVSMQVALIVVSSVVFSFLFFVVFEKTMAGKALRATAVNRIGARIVGIRPFRTGGLAFLLGSALAAISGILVSPVATFFFDSGFMIGLKAFVGAIVGGLASYPLAALGAIFVGLLESYSSFWSSAFKEILVFGILIPVLLWRSLAFAQVEEEEEELDEVET